MTHSFDFPGIAEKLFLLEQLCLGSRDYCKRNGIARNSYPYGHDDWNDYSFRLRRLISSYLIECAAKVRIFEDSLPGLTKAQRDEADATARTHSQIGTVLKGNVVLTVRESCNKIIHATSVDLDWRDIRQKSPNGKASYWTGKYHLHGAHAGRAWHIELDIVPWCNAVDDYLDLLGSKAGWDNVPYE